MPLPNNTRNRTPQNKARTRKLRREMTASERKLWDFLQKGRLGFSFRRQFGIDEYSLDFYCPEVKVCVEVDGPHHEERWFEDKVRDDVLGRLDIKVIRIPSIELFDPNSLHRWLQEIERVCQERRVNETSTPGPVSRRRDS